MQKSLLSCALIVAFGGCAQAVTSETSGGVGGSTSGGGQDGQGGNASSASSSSTASSTGGGGGASSASSTSGSGVPAVCAPGETKACYEGPANTENVGMCKGGIATCAADGASFGPCVGQILPAPEACGNANDEDCDGQVNDPDAGCNPNECAGCTLSAAPACGSTAVVVGHYEGGNKTVCIAAGDGSKFDLALMSYDPTNWTLMGATDRVTRLQVYSFDAGTTIQGNGAIPTNLQIGGNVPADPYNYAMSMGDCPAHTGYAGAVFSIPEAQVCHMETGLPNGCGYPGYACLAISP